MISPSPAPLTSTKTSRSTPATSSGTLLTGTITQFGSLDNGGTTDQFDFRFTVTGGVLPTMFPSDYAGKDIGVTLVSEGSSFTGDFTQNFSGGVKATAGPVPHGGGKSPDVINTVAGPTVVLGSGVKLNDTADLEGGTNPTGTITYYLFAPGVTPNAADSNNVYSDTVTVTGNGLSSTTNGNNPGGYLPTVAGTYQWIAVYSGDANNNAAFDNGIGESEVVSPASPTIVTNAAFSSSNVVGSSISDSATLSGAFSGTGTITFTVTAPDGTTSVAGTANVNGNGTYNSTAITTTEVGIYTFHASYSGDGNNNGAIDNGANESLTTIKGSPLIATVASDTTNVVGSAVMSDKVTVSGGDNPTGTVTFILTAPNGSNTTVGTVTINGDATYSSPNFTATQVGTYTWHASYAGDSLNNGAIDNGSNESLTIIKASPSIATVASDTTNVVGSAVMSDKVTVSGGLTPSGTITFTVTKPDGTTASVGNVTIAGDGTYTSPTITATQVGTYTFHANYAGDTLNNGAVDNGANESLTTTGTTPSLVTTAIVVTTTSNCTNNTYNCGSYKGGSYSIGCGGYTIDCSKNNYNWCGSVGSGTSTGNTTITVTHDTAVLSGGFSETGTITFDLTDQNGNVLDTEKVNVNGNGNYTTSNISITNPSGTYTWSAVYSGDKLNASAHDQGGVNEQFSFNNGGTISGTKFLDITGNGLSGDDTGLGNVTIQLYKDVNGNGNIDSLTDTVIATTTTDSNGNYSFTGLAAGHYIVLEVNPSGYVQTGPVSGQYAVNLASNGSSTGNDFDDFKTEDCVVTCWTYEINGCTKVSDISGQLHQGDVVKVTFTLPQPETISFVSYTAPDSYFNANDASQQKIFDQDIGTFTQAGTYSLTIVVPACDYQVDFVCGLPIDKLGPAGSNIFYTAQGRLHDSDNGGTNCTPPVVTTCNGTGSITGCCFADNNNNGKKDTGDCGLAGTKVTCYGNTNDGKCVIISTTCDANGNYKFSGLPSGNYKVIEHTPNTCYDGSDSLGSCGGTRNDDVCANIVIGAGKSGTGYNFGELCAASISGTVYGDKDKDGNIDTTESGIAGVKITLTGTNDLGQAISLVTYTDASGKYSFDGLRQGTYSLTETEPTGYVTTHNTIGTEGGVASGDTIKTITLEWSDDATGYNFGDYKYA